MRERIVAAAISHPKGVTLSVQPPLRHCDIIVGAKAQGLRLAGWEQGFLTDLGRFVGRGEAYRIASEAGQIISRPDVTPTPGTLYTEDLW